MMTKEMTLKKMEEELELRIDSIFSMAHAEGKPVDDYYAGMMQGYTHVLRILRGELPAEYWRINQQTFQDEEMSA